MLCNVIIFVLESYKPLDMKHIKRVIDVAESFVRDLKGGSGYTDAMRSEC